MAEVWPLVGRRSELRTIAAASGDAETRGVVLVGAAGVGKTRLAREAVAALDPGRFSAVQAVASSASEAIPFGALAHLLPAETPAPGPLNRLGWARDAILSSAIGGRRLVLSVDDAHLLDETSAAVVLHLARTSDAFVLVTVRDSEREPDAVRSLWKDGVLQRVELAPLSLRESADMIGALLGGHVDAGTVHRLWRVTQGNPLYLREMVLAARSADTLTEHDGVFRWTGDVAMAPRLAELIGARLGELDDTETAVLELVAFAEPIGVSLLAELASPAAVDAIEARKLIVVQTDRRRIQARVAHPLFGEAIRARCPALRSRRRMRQLADAVENAGARRRDDTLRLAVWRLETGTAHDPEQMLAACRLAWSASDAPLATRLGWAAVNSGGGVDAAVTLATILNWRGRPEEADTALSTVEGPVLGDADRAKVAGARAQVLYYGLHRADEAIARLVDIERTVHEDAIRQPALVQHIELAQMTGRCDEALRLFDEVMSGPPATEAIGALACILAGQSLGVTGQYSAALECMDRAMAESGLLRQHDPADQARAIAIRHHVELLAGDVAAADDTIRPIYTWTVAEAATSLAFGFMSWCRGQTARLRGDVARARRSCEEASGVLRQQNMSGFDACCLGDLAHACALAGDLAAARAALERADAARSPAMMLYNHWIDVARTWVLACGGDVARAVDHTLEVARRARAAGLVAFEVIATHDALRLGAVDRAAEPLLAVAVLAEGPFAAVCAAHAEAASAGDGEGLLAVAERFAELGMILHAAEAAAQAGTAHRQGGRTARSRAAQAKAWSLARRCEVARTPALLELRAPGLTRSEWEVAHLAAAGLSSRQIADRLVKSVRTIDNHLGNIYSKLGIDNRHDLAEIFVEHLRPGP